MSASPRSRKFLDEREILLPARHQFTDARVVDLKAVGAQAAGLVPQRQEPLPPPRGQHDGRQPDGIGVVAMLLLEAAGEADLLDDGAEGGRAGG